MPTYLNPNSIYGFDSASAGAILTKGSSSSITFQSINAIVPSNVSSFTNDAGYINSGVTAMTHYATSANVVNAINDIDSVVILDGNRWANTALTPAIRYINMPAISSIKSVISDGKTPIIRFRDLKLIDGIESVFSANSVSYLTLVDYTEDNNHIIFNGVDEYNRLITLNGSRPNSVDNWSYKTTELNNMAYGLFANMYMSNGVTICTRSIAEIIAAYNANLPIDIRYRYGSLNFRSYNIEVSNNVVTVHFVDEPEAQNNLIRESDYPVITGTAQTYGDEWGNFTPLILRRGLQITDLADVDLSSVTIANTVLAYDDTTNLVTKGFIAIPEPSSNLSDYINDVGFITSAATNLSGLTEIDYDYIFGDFVSGDLITMLYVDDFPSDRLNEIEQIYGPLENHIAQISGSLSYALSCGTNIFSITPETIEYECETYRVWRMISIDSNGDIKTSTIVGLMKDEDADVEHLQSISMEANINNSYCPFEAVGSVFEALGEVYVGDDLSKFSLVCFNYVTPIIQESQDSSLITKMYVDSFAKQTLAEKLYNNDVGDLIDFVSSANTILSGGDECFDYVDDIMIDGESYSIWENGSGYIGLTETGLTIADVFPYTLEANCSNIKEYSTPFLFLGNSINNLDYTQQQLLNRNKYTTIIKVV